MLIFLTNAIGCIHHIIPATFENVCISKQTFQIYEEVGSTVHFIGKPLMIEAHKQMGHLISIFQMAYLLVCSSGHG